MLTDELATDEVASATQPTSWWPWIGLVAGTAVVAFDYSYAARHRTAGWTFGLFWIGVCLFVAPTAARLVSRATAPFERVALVVALGLFLYLPKFLRNPSMPLYNDELAHWRQSLDVFDTGELFGANPVITIIQFFPGLHAVTAVLRNLTDLSPWHLAAALLAFAHVACVVGVFFLTERFTRSPWAGGVAALVYAINPGFIFFTSQYAYESLALAEFIWVLATLAALWAARGDRRVQLGWFAAGTTITAGCVVTHHITSYVLAFVVVLVAVVTQGVAKLRTIDVDGATVRMTWAFAAVVVGLTGLWYLLVASDVLGYLTPHIGGGVQEVLGLINREQSGRKLFTKTSSPPYERLAAFVSPLLAGLAALASLWLWRRRRSPQGPVLAVVVFGLLYFPSVPFILSASGTEGARRSWAFTYVGLGVLFGIGLVLAARLPSVTGHGRWATAAATMAVLAMLVGNVASDVNAEYRFPGPYVYASDARSLTPELIRAAEWFREAHGSNVPVVADRDAGLAFATFGRASTARGSAGFPIWDLYFDTGLPRAELAEQLEQSGYRYVVVEHHMGLDLPKLGFYFDRNEPLAGERTEPPPAEALAKFDTASWAQKVYGSENISIYRLDFDALRLARTQG